jgi:sulfotransferase
MRLHFISGLPRSGSTLLAAILRQNPKISAGMSGPLFSLVRNMIGTMSASNEFSSQITDQMRERVLRAAMTAYFDSDTAIVFDTNRLWTSKAALVKQLFPESRMFCCVRNPAWIIDSFERLFQRNKTQMATMFNRKPCTTVFSRAETLMNLEEGVLGIAWASLREAWANGGDIEIIRYENLAMNPESIIRLIYESIQEPMFAHDYSNVWFSAEPYDDMIGMPGLHSLRQTVSLVERALIIPQEIWSKYSPLDFWNNPNALMETR